MRVLLPILCLLWLAAAVFGMTQFERLSGQAGTSGQPPKCLPSSLSVILDKTRLDKTRPTLLMLVHPKCPCTWASLAELNRLQALCPGKAAVSVLFWNPQGYPKTWAQTELYGEAKAIPGVQVILDTDGRTARRFGAATSGETLLYAPDGRLLFHGGLTGARGQEGDNAGLTSVVALLQDVPGAARQTPVYGCSLTSCRLRKSGIRP